MENLKVGQRMSHTKDVKQFEPFVTAAPVVVNHGADIMVFRLYQASGLARL